MNTYQVTIKDAHMHMRRYTVEAKDAPGALEVVSKQNEAQAQPWRIVYARVEVSEYPVIRAEE